MTKSEQIIFKNFLEEKFATVPELTMTTFDYLSKLRNNFYKPKNLIDSIFQKFSREPEVDIVDAYCFMQIWARIHIGEILVCYIDIGETPMSDSHVKENNEKLRTLLKLSDIKGKLHSITARFIPDSGYSADNNGFLEWKTPMHLT